MNREFGLIGKKLSHSFSRSYFTEKFNSLGLKDCTYDNFELAEIGLFPELQQSHPNLIGLNVTVPYKESIIPFLDELDEEAKSIGAANCLKKQDGKWIGYNTDAYGFAQSIKPFLDVNHERALVLGTGGSSRAVAYALKKIGVQVFFVTSSPDKKSESVFTYSDLNELIMRSFRLIINTTPLGMFPDVESKPAIPYEYIGKDHLCYDLVYNPAQTLFLHHCALHGATIMNGESMLKLQAEKSWEIWNS